MKTMKSKPITVLGTVLSVGTKAPNFVAVDQNQEKKSLNDFKTPYILLNVVPSLDTGVCDLQTRRFNQELADYKDLTVITLSNDLPFAQKRWCGNAGLDIVTLSDYIDLDFANKYGVNIKENRLLARSVFILDEKRNIIYAQYLDEMSEHPDYDKALAVVKANVKR